MKLALTEAAKADIRAILRRTREQFGTLQVPKYRALLADASLLLLDDALSAVDTQTETSILKHLQELRQANPYKTTVIVSHRLSAVMDAQYILVLKDGRITEQGDHASLIELGGWYCAQWRYQQLEASRDAD